MKKACTTKLMYGMLELERWVEKKDEEERMVPKDDNNKDVFIVF